MIEAARGGVPQPEGWRRLAPKQNWKRGWTPIRGLAIAFAMLAFLACQKTTAVPDSAPPVEVRITGPSSTPVGEWVRLVCHLYLDGVYEGVVSEYEFVWRASTGGIFPTTHRSWALVTAASSRTVTVTCTASGPAGSATDSHTVTVTDDDGA